MISKDNEEEIEFLKTEIELMEDLIAEKKKQIEELGGLENTYCVIQAYDYVDDEGEGIVITDKKILKEIEDKIWEGVFYGNWWHKINGGYCNVEDLGVVDLGDKYLVYAYIEHGEQDMGDGCGKTYKENLEFYMDKEYKILDNN